MKGRDKMLNLIRAASNIFDDVPVMSKGVMNTDIKENEKSYIFEIDLPGFDKNDIKVSTKDEYLVIEASKEKVEENKDDKYIRRERMYGTYSRKFYIGNIQTEELNAKYENGILSILVPKTGKEKQINYLEIK